LLHLWTRKEALLKATGKGMLGDLGAIDVCGDEVNMDGQDYYLHSLTLHPEQFTALAVGAREAGFSLQCWQPR
jgi:phosphopantetheinyl transferase